MTAMQDINQRNGVNENVNENKSVNGLARMTCHEDVPAKEGVNIQRRKSRRSFSEYPPDQQAKMKAFWQHKSILCKTAGHCSGCGKPWTESKTCPVCRKRYAEYKRRKREGVNYILAVEAAKSLTALARRIASLEIAVARLQLMGQKRYQRGWDKGYRKGCGKIETQKRVMRYEVGNEFMNNTQTSAEELKNLCVAFRTVI